MTTDFQKICTQLQIQRNQFADAHATAAARAEALAEELERVKAEGCADRFELRCTIERQQEEIDHLKAKIAELEKPKPEMLPERLPVTIDDQEEIPF